jgi:hypothetical protein
MPIFVAPAEIGVERIYRAYRICCSPFLRRRGRGTERNE